MSELADGNDETKQTSLNKSDIEHLEKKTEDLEEKIDKLRNDTPTKENFEQLETTIRKVLLEGNGDKPLTIQVAKNRSKMKENRSRISRMYAIIASIGSITLTGLSKWLFKWIG